jgi:translation initiation factor 2 subunit 1
MLYRRKGFPEEDELVLCTVTKIFPHSVFCNLDEFGRTGVIHISEIAPGRIRNIRNYVRHGKKVICKVLRINKQKGHIDLSLRRVNEGQKRGKKNEIKQEILAEKIVEFIAKKKKQDVKKLYDIITRKVFEKYLTLYSCFEDVINNKVKLADLGIDKNLAKELEEIINQRITPPEVGIKGKFKIKLYDGRGIEIIKNVLKEGKSISEDIEIIYESAGNYNVVVKAKDYQEAENKLKKLTDKVINEIESEKGEAEFIRKK